MRVEKKTTLLCNKRVLVRSWKPEFSEEPRALLLIVHGLGEHSGRYDRLARDLVERNKIEIYSFDLPGHGETAGLRGYISKFEDFFEFIHELVRSFNNYRRARILFGHSLGGLIAVRYVQEHCADFDGVILSSPAIVFNIDNKVKATIPILRILNLIVPWLTTSNGIDPKDLSRNQVAVEKYVSDPLVHNRISIRLFCEMLKSANHAKRKLKEIEIPLLLLGGTSDKIVPFDKVAELIKVVPGSQIGSFDGGYHELFEDLEHYHHFLDLISNWIENKIIETREKRYA